MNVGGGGPQSTNSGTNHSNITATGSISNQGKCLSRNFFNVLTSGSSVFCLSVEPSKVASKKSGGMHNSKNHPLASSIVGGKNPGTSHMD